MVDHEPIFDDSIVSKKRMQIITAAKTLIQAMLKLKLRLMFHADSTLKVLWNR